MKLGVVIVVYATRLYHKTWILYVCVIRELWIMRKVVWLSLSGQTEEEFMLDHLGSLE